MTDGTDIQEAMALIRAAFGGLTRRSGMGWHQAEAIDDSADAEQMQAAIRADEQERGRPWWKIDEDPLHGDLLIFLDDPGFRYYIPLYMTWCLANQDGPNSDLFTHDQTVFEIGRRPAFIFDAKQRAAITAFLRINAAQEAAWRAGGDHSSGDDYTEGLAAWLKKCEPVDALENQRVELVAQIRTAFGDVTRRDGRSTAEASAVDLYADDEQLADVRAANAHTADTPWWEMTDEQVVEAFLEAGRSLTFLDDGGLVYYLPAFMTWMLEHRGDQESYEMEESIMWHLPSQTPAIFTDAQRAVVTAFMEYHAHIEARACQHKEEQFEPVSSSDRWYQRWLKRWKTNCAALQ